MSNSPFDRTLWPAELTDTEYVLPRYNIFPHMAAGGVLLLIAPPKHGKSFAALEIAWAIASGNPFFGHPVDVQGPTLYVAGEGAEETSGRVVARQRASREPFPPHLGIYPHPIDLKDHEALEEFAAWASVRGFAALIFDTVARCGGGKEDAEDLTKLVNGVTYLSTELACSVILLHHTPKADPKSSRGHTSLPAAVDAQWLLDKKDGVYTVTPSFSRSNEDQAEPIAAFRVENVILGTNDDGREVGYGCAVPCAIPAPATPKTRKPRENQRTKILRMIEGGMSRRQVAEVLGVDEKTIRNRLRGSGL